MTNCLQYMKNREDLLFHYLGIIYWWLFCLGNDMLTNIILLFQDFCFRLRLININTASSIRTKGSSILGQRIPCNTLDIMEMGIQNLMDRTWRTESSTKVYKLSKHLTDIFFTFFKSKHSESYVLFSHLCLHPIWYKNYQLIQKSEMHHRPTTASPEHPSGEIYSTNSPLMSI